MPTSSCSLIEHRRIRTTLAKAKALRPYAEKLVTLGKRGTCTPAVRPSPPAPQGQREEALRRDRPRLQGPQGGYTRITKLGQRRSDSAPMAFIEWVDAYVPKAAAAPEAEAAAEPAAEDAAPKKKAPAKKKAAPKKKAAAAE
jgi:large subunit ribosomal protein L17